MKKPFNNFHNEQILKLDVKQQQPNKIPRFVQYDSALLKLELYDNGKLYDVSRADEFVISAKRPDGSKVSGLAEYDGEFITYKLSKQDLEMLGETSVRLQVYEGRNRLSSLSFRYDVYEDYEAVGNPDDVTLLSALLSQVRDALAEAQRQGGYAENRGDFANAAGDYANTAGDSQKMRWLKWVKTVEERNSTYRNPRNGDTLYVVNVADKSGGAVYRYNSMERPAKWEEISGWDTSIIQDIYNLIDTKEDKTKVAKLVDQLQKELENTRFGAHNIIQQTDTSVATNDSLYSPINSISEVSMVSTSSGRVVQAGLPANTSQSYFGAAVGNSNGRRFSVREGETLTLSFIGTKSLTATDFTYVYLMRPNSEGSNTPMALKLKHEIDSSGYDKYEFNVTAPWSSDNAYILIGANKNPSYGNDSAFWVRFKDVMLVRGNRATDWAISLEDLINNYKDLIRAEIDEVNGELTEHNSRIKQLEDKIEMTVTETVYDDKMNQIAQWQSDYEQTARDITTTVSKKVGVDEIVSKINQSAEKISIDAKKIELGGDVVIEDGKAKINHIDLGRATATGRNNNSTLLITGDMIEQSGRFNRRYHGVSYDYNVKTTLKGGYLRFGDENRSRALNISNFGISTFLDGNGEWADAPGSSGYIQWWDGTYSPSNSNGITMGSYNVVALKSDNNRIVLDAEMSVSIESKASPVYIYPYKRDRPGLNRFNFTTATSSNSTQVHGYIMYGAGDDIYPYKAGLRFYKNESRVAVVGEHFATGGSTVIEAGTAEVNTVKRRDGNRYVNIQSYDLFAVGSDDAGDRVTSNSIYKRTYSSAANLHITGEGTIGRSISARKYKLAIEKQFENISDQIEHSKKVLQINPKTWFDKHESETYAKEITLEKKLSDDNFNLRRHFGMIADEFDELGLTELVQYNDKKEVEGLAYDRMSVHHNVLIKDLYDENDSLKSEIEELKSQINEIMEKIK